MTALKDLTGQKIDKLTVIRRATPEEIAGRKGTYWYCKCDCGGTRICSSSTLKNGKNLSCGCEGRKTTFIDLTGKKFGRLTVLEKVGKKGNEYLWKCQCDCGNQCVVKGVNLRSGGTKSCGCLKKEKDHAPKGNVIDLTGQKFNHLTVIRRDGSSKQGEAKWLCQCDCGNPTLISVTGRNLRTGHTQSCGCDRRSHGENAIFNLLIKNNIPFETEKVMFKYANGTNSKFDFYIPNNGSPYLIEYDGETHYNYNLHGWHTQEQLKKQQERDAIKNQWCRDNNIPLIRIPYTHLQELNIEDLRLDTSKYII